ncbi:MAG: oxidoreductase [Bacteroidetes bacterium]|nr:oxidoreductase [Bacteroidota bacterium]
MSPIKEIQDITIIGLGNVAWQYSNAMQGLGLNVRCISSRGEIKEEDLKSDLIIIAVSDKAIEEVADKLRINNSILVHTSGSMDMEILKARAENYGVFYPLQTLSKGNDIDFSLIPLCIEASNQEARQRLNTLASKLTPMVYDINSEQRKQLHIAAVFACNFTNHLLGIAKEELDKKNIPFNILFPLIDQTIEKAKLNNPFDVQTGPAIRNDDQVMEIHKSSLEDDEREIYELISEKIKKKDK